MASPALVVRINGDTSGLKSALKEADSGLSVFGKSVSVGGVAAMAGLAGAAVVAGKALLDMTMSAAADRDETAKLNATIAAATGSTADYTAAVDAAIVAGQELAFTDSETRAALAPLVTATGDVALATEQLAVAQDIARLAGVDLATAANAVAKADQGQDKALRSLIPGLEVGKTATETLANAQKAAAGQAKLYGNSQAGQSAKMADAFSELGETIGSALLPLLDAILPALLPILRAFGELIKALLPVLVPLIKLLASALGTVLSVLLKVVNALVGFIAKISRAIDLVRDFLGKVPGLSGIKLPGTSSAGTQVGTFGAQTRAISGSSGGSAPGVVINITGDPVTIERTVVRALRTYARRNGGMDLGLGTT
jgi:hypothetical protein